MDIFASLIAKPILDRLLKGDTLKEVQKSFFTEPTNANVAKQDEGYECTHCCRKFKIERALKSHTTKMHKDVRLGTKVETKNESTGTESTESDSERAVLKCDKCEFRSVNKAKIKKHMKKPHATQSPVQKKLKLAHDMSMAIVEDIIKSIQDSCEEDSETDKELKKLETVSYEEQRVDDQLMDHKVEQERNLPRVTKTIIY